MTDAGTEGLGGRYDAPGSSAERVDLVLSEERLRTMIEAFPLERVRLEKYIVSEEQNVTITVRREEVRVVRTPVTDPFDADGSHETGDAPVVMVLHAERAIVTTEVVPVERVWLQKERVTEQQVVTADLRSERVGFDE